MPQPTKPGVNWAEIESRYRAGATSTVLSREYPVSRQAIDKKAKREGWVAEQRRARLRDATVATVAKPRHSKDRYGLRCPENITRALELAEAGLPQSAIAAGIGMTSDAFSHWLDADPDFRMALHQHWSLHVEARVGNINDAAGRGDARAAQWAAERNPLTRDDFGQSGRGNSLGGITVVINVPRTIEEAALLIEGQTVQPAQLTHAGGK